MTDDGCICRYNTVLAGKLRSIWSSEGTELLAATKTLVRANRWTLNGLTGLNRDLPESVAATDEILRWALVGVERQEDPLAERSAKDFDAAREVHLTQ